MNKSILVLAAVAAAAVSFFSAPSAEARGLRFGIGFAPAFGAQFNRADPTILQRASEANQRIIARERGMYYGSRTVVVSRPNIAAQRAAEAREARRQAAAAAARAKAEKLAAAAEAKRLARIKTVEKTTIAKSQVPAAAAAVVAAPVAATVLSQPAPVETKVVATPVSVNAATPIEPAPVATVPASAAPAKAASSAECLRFIPGAGVTVKVSCTE